MASLAAVSYRPAPVLPSAASRLPKLLLPAARASAPARLAHCLLPSKISAFEPKLEKRREQNKTDASTFNTPVMFCSSHQSISVLFVIGPIVPFGLHLVVVYVFF